MCRGVSTELAEIRAGAVTSGAVGKALEVLSMPAVPAISEEPAVLEQAGRPTPGFRLKAPANAFYVGEESSP
jgi:hypothetical protein